VARRSRRRGRTTRYQGVVHGEVIPSPDKDVRVKKGPPEDLYELLGVQRQADQNAIKKAYYEKQKLCHPDIAGPDGEEICILLNDAYDLLSKEASRAVYDEQLQPKDKDKKKPLRKSDQYPETELLPTWKWSQKNGNNKPVWSGSPRSLSRWEKVKPEGRGEKHEALKFAFVDELRCISCRNCCDIAPKTFCIDADNGRARVYAQWGDTEEYLDYALAACPVDCIAWVERSDLSYLEYCMADHMYAHSGGLPCPMAIRQGTILDNFHDVYSEAAAMKDRLQAKEQKALRQAGTTQSGFADRISEVFGGLGQAIRKVGWGY